MFDLKLKEKIGGGIIVFSFSSLEIPRFAGVADCLEYLAR
jgi:hypothetical protein